MGVLGCFKKFLTTQRFIFLDYNLLIYQYFSTIYCFIANMIRIFPVFDER